MSRYNYSPDTSEREHLLSELDSLENRQYAIHQERAALDTEEAILVERKILIHRELGVLATPIIFGYGANGEYL